MERTAFEKLVDEGIQAIPKKFLDKLSNVAIIVESEPSEEQLTKNHIGHGFTLYGLYEGVPQTSRGSLYGWVLPDKITIFQKPIENAAKTSEKVRQIVKDTVWHEIAHHFGMNEGEVRDREKKNKK